MPPIATGEPTEELELLELEQDDEEVGLTDGGRSLRDNSIKS